MGTISSVSVDGRLWSERADDNQKSGGIHRTVLASRWSMGKTISEVLRGS